MGPNNWGIFLILPVTTGEGIGPAGEISPVVCMLKNALVWSVRHEKAMEAFDVFMKWLRPHLHYTGFYRRVASWNDLCRIGQLFTLYRIELQQYGVTSTSPTERSDVPSNLRSVSYFIALACCKWYPYLIEKYRHDDSYPVYCKRA